MTLYIFSALKTLRDIVPPAGLTGLVHDESAYTVSATIPMDLTVVPGEHIGFLCVDGRFRMFTVTKAENKDFDATTIITGIDTAVQELKETIVPELQQLEVNLHDSVVALLDASDARSSWSVTGSGPADLKKHRAYYTSMWTMLETLAQLYEWRIIPHYYFASGAITGRTIELAADTATFRGRILQSKKDASNVYVIKSTPPITRLYGLGPSKSQEPGVSENLTFAEAEWSTAAGDPANKPKEQTYVDDPAAVAKYGVRSSTVQFDEVEDEKDLLQKTWNHLQTIKEPTCTVEATVQDLEQVPGYETKIIRLGDLVPVRLSNAAMEEARVIGIERDYVKPWLTKVTIGDKTDSLSTQVTNLMTNALHTHETLTIYKNRFHEDEALIQLNAQFVQANAERIELNAQLIGLYATYTDELTGRVTAAEIELDGMNATIDLWAGTLDEFGRRLDGAEIRIDGLKKEIDINAANIALNAENIALNAERIQANADAIELNAKNIALNAEKIQLNADQIELNAKNIALNAEKIQLNADQIELNARNIALNAEKIQLNADQIELNAKNIALNAEKIQLNADQIELNAKDIALNAENIELNAKNIALNAEKIQLNADQIELNAKDIALNAENIDLNAKNINLNAEKIQANADQIEVNAKAITVNAESIETNAKNIQVNADAIAVNADEISVIAGRVDVQAETITAQAGLISAKADQVDLEAQTIRINAVETTITGLVKTEDLETEVLEVLESANIVSLTVTNLNSYSVNGGSATFDNVSADWLTMGGSTVATEEWVEEQGFLKSADGVEGSIATQEWVQNQGYATQAWVNNKDYVLNSSLPSILISYATKNWVTEQGYLKSIPSTYATQSWVQSQGYLKSVPSNYATQAWVISQDYAAKSWVEGKGYLTAVPSGYATETWVEGKGYLTAVPIGYATETWVEGKGYLTEIPSGYATQDWVAENFSKASVTYKPTTIERYGSVSGNSIPVRALNAGGTVLLTGTVDAGDVYEAGEDSVTLSAGEWASNKMTVTASNGETLVVDASSIYNEGANAGFNGGYNMAITGAMIELDGSTVKVYSPDGGIAGPTLDISSNLDEAYDDGYADATPTGVDRTATYNSADNTYSLSIKVKSADGSSRDFTAVALNAAAAYNAGYKAAKDSATLTCEGVNAIVTFGDGTTKTLDLSEYVTVTGGIRSITNTAQNYYMAQGYANAYINGVDVDYTTFSKAQSFG